MAKDDSGGGGGGGGGPAGGGPAGGGPAGGGPAGSPSGGGKGGAVDSDNKDIIGPGVANPSGSAPVPNGFWNNFVSPVIALARNDTLPTGGGPSRLGAAIDAVSGPKSVPGMYWDSRLKAEADPNQVVPTFRRALDYPATAYLGVGQALVSGAEALGGSVKNLFTRDYSISPQEQASREAASAAAAQKAANEARPEYRTQQQWNEYAAALKDTANAERNLTQSGTVIPKGDYRADDFTPPLSNAQLASMNAARDPNVISKMPPAAQESYMRMESQSAFDKARAQNAELTRAQQANAMEANKPIMDALKNMSDQDLKNLSWRLARPANTDWSSEAQRMYYGYTTGGKEGVGMQPGTPNTYSFVGKDGITRTVPMYSAEAVGGDFRKDGNNAILPPLPEVLQKGFTSAPPAPTLNSALYGAPKGPQQNLPLDERPFTEVFPDKTPGDATLAAYRQMATGQTKAVEALNPATGKNEIYWTKPDTPDPISKPGLPKNPTAQQFADSVNQNFRQNDYLVPITEPYSHLELNSKGDWAKVTDNRFAGYRLKGPDDFSSPREYQLWQRNYGALAPRIKDYLTTATTNKVGGQITDQPTYDMRAAQALSAAGPQNLSQSQAKAYESRRAGVVAKYKPLIDNAVPGSQVKQDYIDKMNAALKDVDQEFKPGYPKFNPWAAPEKE